MISFFGDNTRNKIFAVESNNTLTKEEVDKLTWVFGEKSIINCNEVNYTFLGPRAAMITPWSTNAVEICQNKKKFVNFCLKNEIFPLVISSSIE